ncbi:probable dolichyl pyrophosphate Glc1Man9GlcNAc2 alpha-1,3-glucosyltransferase isoform X2 [Actinidia eriantha]|uniref:probable dolichyl pyrophosphate Glc1Man9GlcNAc2 alpha-1,3-glucosyltransferase isoform X2 n=1 Tax=Actinidia eriantha TaxID=165200 RepID=UPI00258FBAB9|nr:probable dolichyl pyrophosphate Glc1Man9GlcNAc2 alpha-1,3-glucosyltransferase isoform X2 [Actinidia eriantha]
MTTPENPKTQISSPNPIADLAWFSLIAACVKILLIPSYHSTDFEVHRHWLALTHSLSLPNWYSDETSPWTLDYPPFFAHFERFLSLFSKLVDPTIVDLHNGLNYKSPSVIIFQRLTVIVSDTVLIYGIYRLGRKLGSRERNLIWVLVVWSPGLLIVDHMHFQYNGFLMGILLVSLSLLEEGRDLAGGFVFAVLLCFKHLFAVAAPVYFVYLLRHYCREAWVRGFRRLVAMGTVVVAVFVAAYGPFVYYGRIQQVFHRMFPFGRGLCHAYWAPNFWVFYILLDKGLAFMLAKLGFNIQVPTASFTGGLVGDTSPFAVLPRAWRSPQPRMITRWVAYAYTCGFLFGWHVHEKASLHFVIPLAIVATQSMEDARHYFILSIVSCYSLFPLLFEAQEYPIKVLLLLLHSILMWFGFSSQFSQITSTKAQATGQKKSDKLGLKESPGISTQKGAFDIGYIGMSYIFGFLVVETWGRFLHPIILGNRLPFLPLLMISIYCALGVMYSWIWQLRRIISTR